MSLPSHGSGLPTFTPKQQPRLLAWPHFCLRSWLLPRGQPHLWLETDPAAHLLSPVTPEPPKGKRPRPACFPPLLSPPLWPPLCQYQAQTPWPPVCESPWLHALNPDLGPPVTGTIRLICRWGNKGRWRRGREESGGQEARGKAGLWPQPLPTTLAHAATFKASYLRGTQ